MKEMRDAMTFNEDNLKQLINAVDFAANKHRFQKRKDPEATPYINHPIKVTRLLIEKGNVYDINVLIGAILHDTIEDTKTTKEELMEIFGNEVTSYVIEMTDDKSIPKAERKRLQIENAPNKSYGAKQIKLCDKICNITDVIHNPPDFWDLQRRKDYLDWAENVVAGLRGINPILEKIFDDKIKEGRKLLDESTHNK